MMSVWEREKRKKGVDPKNVSNKDKSNAYLNLKTYLACMRASESLITITGQCLFAWFLVKTGRFVRLLHVRLCARSPYWLLVLNKNISPTQQQQQQQLSLLLPKLRKSGLLSATIPRPNEQTATLAIVLYLFVLILFTFCIRQPDLRLREYF